MTEIRSQMSDITPAVLHVSQADGITAYYGPSGDIISSTGAPSVDQLQAIPLWSGLGETVDRIAFNVTGGGTAGSKGRCGLYRGDLATMKPTALVLDGGEFDTTTTGLKEATISQVLAAETLYFLAFLCGTASPTCTTMTSGPHIFGRNSSLNAQFGWVKTGFSYAALPDPFPSSPSILTSNAVMVVRRLAAFNRPIAVHGNTVQVGGGAWL